MAYTTINKHTDYFNTVLWTGNGSTMTITDVGFNADLVWTKLRSGTDDYRLFDKVRGITKYVRSNTTAAESTDAILSTTSNGYSLASAGEVTANNGTFVGWNWKANGAGSSNSDGSVTSTVSASTTSGFSIVKWTGTGANATIGHGLGVKPEMIWIKNTGAVENWIVYHKTLTAEYNLKLNLADAQQDTAGAFNDTEPTTSVFTVSTNTNANQSGQTMIAYCFASKDGYSRIGSYKGNGNADGPFVYTGMAPQFVLFKRSSGSAGDWQLWDTKRDAENPTEKALHCNANGGPSTDQDIDILSNGFKIRSTQGHLNNSGVVFPYIAFGQTLVGDNDIPVTGR